MKKPKLVRTQLRIPEATRKKARKIAKQETGEAEITAGVVIAVENFILNRK